MAMRNCLTCKWEPDWIVTGYDSMQWASKSGYCNKPMPFSDRRLPIEFDTEWNEGLGTNCPAWEPKEAI
jgi:hypothetical protein